MKRTKALSKTYLSNCINICLLGFFSSAPAIAQDQSSSLVLEEVTVTARKIEENMQQTPIAVSAFSGTDLETRGAIDVTDIGAITPNVSFGTGATFSGSSSAPTVFVRGIGQADFIIVADPAVGIYLDGVYVARSIGGIVDLLDLERAEVLRGPQGTLFGRNSIGGAINLISKKPDDSRSGKVDLTIGEDEHYEAKFNVNIPFSDNVFGRLSGLYRKRDGYVDATQYSNLKLGEDNVIALRGQLRFTPSDDVTIDVNADYTRERESPGASYARNIGDLRGAVGGSAGEGNRFNAATGNPACLTPEGRNTNTACYGSVFLSGRYTNNSVWTDINGNRITPENELDLFGASATIEWDTPLGLFKSITAYREFDSVFYNDLDFSPHVVFHNINNPFEQDQFSQELQLASAWMDDRLRTVIGAYYFKEEGTEIVQIARVFERLSGLNNTRSIENTSEALFAQATLDITDNLHLTTGLRWTDDKKIFDATILFAAGNALGPSRGVQTATETTPLVTLGYDLDDNKYLYFTYAEGFRDGGFPARFTGGLPDPLPFFEPEFVESLEVGFKSEWLDNRLRLNIAAFRTDYDDIQVTATAVGATDINTLTDNLAGAQLTGVELELNALLTENFRIDLNLGYLDNEITSLAGTSLVSAGFSVTESSELPYTPELNWNLGASYRIPLSDGAEIFTRVDWQYTDEQYFRIENNPDSFEDSYSVVNASATYKPGGSSWEVAMGIRNLTDEAYSTTSNFSGVMSATFASISRPRTVYATFRYFWGE